MDLVTTIYIYTGGFLVMGFFGILMAFSGKSILFDILRKLQPKGCDVYMINSTRHIRHEYKIPKGGIFIIDKKPYVTNPDKVLSMSDDSKNMVGIKNLIKFKEEIRQAVKGKEARINKVIKKFQEKIDLANSEIKKLTDISANKAKIDMFKALIEDLNSKINAQNKLLEHKEEIYYNKRRPAFIYIENDPIPKDMHEWYTGMDSEMIDNVIARSMTKDPKAMKNIEKEVQSMKWLLILTLIAAAAAAVIAITNKTDIQTLAASLGTITV